MTLAPLDLISALQRVTFTTYALNLSFFEAVILDALIRAALICDDVHRIRASLSEQGSTARRQGLRFIRRFRFCGVNECHLLVNSGNLTFGGRDGTTKSLNTQVLPPTRLLRRRNTSSGFLPRSVSVMALARIAKQVSLSVTIPCAMSRCEKLQKCAQKRSSL